MYTYACLLCLSTYACMHAAFCFHVNGLVVRWSIGAGGRPERLNRRNLGGAGDRRGHAVPHLFRGAGRSGFRVLVQVVVWL
jgi:hypothetical protein